MAKTSCSSVIFLTVILGLLTVIGSCLPTEVQAHHAGYTPTAPREAGDDTNISSARMVNSPTASTLGKGKYVVGFTFDHVRFDVIPTQEAHELHEEGRDIHGKDHEESYNMHAGYGLAQDLDLFLVVPIISKSSIQIEDSQNLGRDERATGFGDMRVLGKYRFWKDYVEAAVLAGLKLPTGETSDVDKSGAKFEPEQQPGNGSWDAEFGLALSRNFNQHLSLATSFLYILQGEGAQDRKAGDVFQYNLGTSFARLPLGKQPNISFGVELNMEWAERDHSRNENRVRDSGGTTILATPEVTLQVSKDVDVFWAIPLPIHQDLGGRHEELKYRILTGVSWSF